MGYRSRLRSHAGYLCPLKPLAPASPNDLRRSSSGRHRTEYLRMKRRRGRRRRLNVRSTAPWVAEMTKEPIVGCLKALATSMSPDAQQSTNLSVITFPSPPRHSLTLLGLYLTRCQQLRQSSPIREQRSNLPLGPSPYPKWSDMSPSSLKRPWPRDVGTRLEDSRWYSSTEVKEGACGAIE